MDDHDLAVIDIRATVGSADWPGAVAALQKAQDLMRASNFMQTTESWLRLPLFLQQAGRFDEAMTEFNRLLEETDVRVAAEFSHQPPFIQRGATHHVRATIYDKMRVACKRQKLPAEAEKYEALRDGYWEKHKKFNKLREMHRKRERAKFEAKRAARRAE